MAAKCYYESTYLLCKLALRKSQGTQGEIPCGVQANTVVYDIVVSEFKLQLRYCVHFRVNTLWRKHEPTYPPPAMF